MNAADSEPACWKARRWRRRYKACGTPLTSALAPSELWCAAYKGEFLLGNRQYCYLLTVTDYRSRYLLACEGLESTKSRFAFSVFERTFREFGLPAAIRTDNGTPFAAPWALFGPSRLAVWWLRLGIRLQRETPRHFQSGQLRTLQRRLKQWRSVMAHRLVFGAQEVTNAAIRGNISGEAVR